MNKIYFYGDDFTVNWNTNNTPSKFTRPVEDYFKNNLKGKGITWTEHLATSFNKEEVNKGKHDCSNQDIIDLLVQDLHTFDNTDTIVITTTPSYVFPIPYTDNVDKDNLVPINMWNSRNYKHSEEDNKYDPIPGSFKNDKKIKDNICKFAQIFHHNKLHIWKLYYENIITGICRYLDSKGIEYLYLPYTLWEDDMSIRFNQINCKFERIYEADNTYTDTHFSNHGHIQFKDYILRNKHLLKLPY